MYKIFPVLSVKLCFFLFIQLSFFKSYSQCATRMDDQVFNDLKNYKEKTALSRTTGTETMMHVPLKIHIITKDDGTGGIALEEVMKGITHTNNSFIDAGIQFYVTGEPNIIKSTEFYTINETTENKYAPLHEVADACNIFYGNEVIVDGEKYGGYAYFPGRILRIMMSNSSAANSKTLPHEMGHFYGLPHTFNNSDHPDISKRELVTRLQGSNCSVAGDLICDTPADPFIFGSSSTAYFENCVYTGHTSDPNGDFYAPLIDNLMSYYNGCKNFTFTNGQLEVIKSYKTHSGRVILTNPGTQVITPSGLSATVNSIGININWTDNSSNETGFMIEMSTGTAGKFKTIAFVPANTQTYYYKNPSPFTAYQFRIKAANVPGSYSNVASVTTEKQYCIPNPVLACNTSGNGYYSIANVTLTGETILENASSCEQDGYAFFSNLNAKLFTGEGYGIRIQQATTETGSLYGGDIGVWIDYNDNGIFGDAHEFTKLSKTDFKFFIGQILVPHNTTPGEKRMRIRVVPNYHPGMDSTFACKEFDVSETEDYLVTIEKYPTTFPVTISAFQQSKYEMKVSWGNSSLPGNTKCNIERSSALNGVYEKVDTVSLSRLHYLQEVNENKGYFYRLRTISDKKVISNKAGVMVTNYTIPFSLLAKQNGNVISLLLKGDSAVFKKVILQRSEYVDFDFYENLDTLNTNNELFHDYRILATSNFYKFRLVDLKGKVVSDEVIITITNNYCQPVFKSTDNLLSDIIAHGIVTGNGNFEKNFTMMDFYSDFEKFGEIKEGNLIKSGQQFSIDVINDFDCYIMSTAKSIQNNLAIWIDFNEDMKFSGNEIVFNKSYPQINCIHTIPVTIPALADGGAKKVRIITTPLNVPISDPCGSYAYGRVADSYILLDRPDIHTAVVQGKNYFNVSVFPNPSDNGSIAIESYETISKIELYNQLGNLVLETSDPKIENLKSGLYLINVYSESGDKIFRSKVIVK